MAASQCAPLPTQSYHPSIGYELVHGLGCATNNDQLLEEFHQAQCIYEASSPGTSHRIGAFVELVSAELALKSRVGEDYLRNYHEWAMH